MFYWCNEVVQLEETRAFRTVISKDSIAFPYFIQELKRLSLAYIMSRYSNSFEAYPTS